MYFKKSTRLAALSSYCVIFDVRASQLVIADTIYFHVWVNADQTHIHTLKFTNTKNLCFVWAGSSISNNCSGNGFRCLAWLALGLDAAETHLVQGRVEAKMLERCIINQQQHPTCLYAQAVQTRHSVLFHHDAAEIEWIVRKRCMSVNKNRW